MMIGLYEDDEYKCIIWKNGWGWANEWACHTLSWTQYVICTHFHALFTQQLLYMPANWWSHTLSLRSLASNLQLLSYKIHGLQSCTVQDLPKPLRARSVVFLQWLSQIPLINFTLQHYELHFPRITKIFQIGEHHWKESVNLQEVQKIAHSAIGQDRLNKDIDNWCNDLWGKPVSPGVKCSHKRKATADTWEDKLAALDWKVSRQKGMKIKAIALEWKAQKADNSFDVWQPVIALQPLGTRVNLELSPTFIHSSLQVHQSLDDISLHIIKSPLATHAMLSMFGNANLRTRYPSLIIPLDKVLVEYENKASSSSISEVMVPSWKV